MSVSAVVTASIMIVSMIAVLATLANFIVTYAVNMNKVLELKRLEGSSQKPMLLVVDAYVEGCNITFKLRNLGPTSAFMNPSSTLIVDYYVNETAEHAVEVLSYGVSWYVAELVVGNNSYPMAVGEPVELKPGATAVIRASLGFVPSPNQTVVLVLMDGRGVRTEYVFTYS